MLHKFFLLLLPPLVFLGFLALLIMVWYIALPLLIVLFVASWWRARQIRRVWEKFYTEAMQAPMHARRAHKKVANETIIDADYEEVKE